MEDNDDEKLEDEKLEFEWDPEKEPEKAWR